MQRRTLEALHGFGLFLVLMIPLAIIGKRVWLDQLPPDPVAYLEHASGDWALRFLLLGMAITPIRRITGWMWPARRRRMVGLTAFFYAALHVLIYAGIDLGWSWALLSADLVKRWYIIVGFGAFVLLIPLAATSTKWAIKRIGGPAWQRLHRLVYLAGVLAVAHFYLEVKRDIREPVIYAVILLVLLGLRRIPAVIERQSARAALFATPPVQ